MNEKKLTVDMIDSFHDTSYDVGGKYPIEDIYNEIASRPIEYIFTNGYLRNFFLFTVCPFFFLIFVNSLIWGKVQFGSLFDLLFLMVLLWVWFNKNTCYFLIKLLMIFYSFFPIANIFYHGTGKLIHIRFIKVCLGIILTIASIQAVYQIFSH